MRVRYKLKDYYKEAIDKYRQQVNSKGQYLHSPGFDDNSLTRYLDSERYIVRHNNIVI